jgi:hypothetical protein
MGLSGLRTVFHAFYFNALPLHFKKLFRIALQNCRACPARGVFKTGALPPGAFALRNPLPPEYLETENEQEAARLDLPLLKISPPEACAIGPSRRHLLVEKDRRAPGFIAP